MALTVLKGCGLQFKDFTGWKSSPLVDSESLPGLRDLRKPCGFTRLSKLTWKFSTNLIDCWCACYRSLRYTELNNGHKIFVWTTLLSIFLRKYSFQHEGFDRIQNIKGVQNQDKCHSGMLQECCRCVMASLGSCDSGSGIGTVCDFGHHSSSRVLAVRHEMSSQGDQRSGNITYEKTVKELECCSLGKHRLMGDVITIFNCVIGCCRVAGNTLFSTFSGDKTRTSMLNCSRRD